MMANEKTDSALRFRNGLPAEAMIEDKVNFADHCVRNYRNQYWHKESLSEFFADDFRSLTIDEFEVIESDTRRNLRNVLPQRGFYVRKGRNLSIASSLHQEDIPWPLDDPDKPTNLPHQSASNDERCEKKGIMVTIRRQKVLHYELIN